jgi:hypothetical protein
MISEILSEKAKTTTMQRVLTREGHRHKHVNKLLKAVQSALNELPGFETTADRNQKNQLIFPVPFPPYRPAPSS